jgi:two-component system cell cycle response regulator CtrA
VDDQAQLRRENEMLREQVRRLNAALAPAIETPVEWRLTATEQRIYAHLASRSRATKAGVVAAAFGHRLDLPDGVSVESHVAKMRRKLQPFGISVRSERFGGYWLERHDA